MIAVFETIDVFARFDSNSTAIVSLLVGLSSTVLAAKSLSHPWIYAA